MNKKIIGILIIIIIILVIIFLTPKETKQYAKEMLSDEEINDYIIDLWVNFDDNFEKYTKEQLVVISLTAYDSEINNGGLYQFLSNSSKVFAPYILDSLDKVNAKKHKKQFDEFITKNKIDIKKLDSYTSDNIDEYLEKYKNYSYEDFDREYYNLEKDENLSKLMIEYVKNNYDEIVKIK